MGYVNPEKDMDRKAADIVRASGHSLGFRERRWTDYAGGDIDQTLADNRDAIYGALARELGVRPDDIMPDDVRQHAHLIADEDLGLTFFD